MFEKKQRIPRFLFNALSQKKAIISHSPNITLRTTFWVVDESRFSFVVSKKAANKAAQRNLIRRRGYAAVREILHTTEPAAYIFFFKKSALGLSFSDLKAEIRKLVVK